MNRREFSAVLGSAVAAGSLNAYAQQSAAPSSPVRQDWLDGGICWMICCLIPTAATTSSLQCSCRLIRCIATKAPWKCALSARQSL